MISLIYFFNKSMTDTAKRYKAAIKKRSANDLGIKISLLRNSLKEIHIANTDKTKGTQVFIKHNPFLVHHNLVRLKKIENVKYPSVFYLQYISTSGISPKTRLRLKGEIWWPSKDFPQNN